MATTHQYKKHSASKVKHVNVQRAINARGRVFEGIVVKKFPKRVVIEGERTLYMYKYERFYKKKMRLHARLPDGMDVEIGDIVRIQECRPLSKIIHHIVIGKAKSSAPEQKKAKA